MWVGYFYGILGIGVGVAIVVFDIGTIAPDYVLAKNLVLEVNVGPEGILVVQDPLADRATNPFLLCVLHLNVLLGGDKGFEDFVAHLAPDSPVRKLNYLPCFART